MRNKRILSFLLSALIALSLTSTSIIASANDIEIIEEADPVKNIGLADEITLLEENNLLKNNDLTQLENINNEVSHEEQVSSYIEALKENAKKTNSSEENSEELASFLDEYKAKNNVNEFVPGNEQISLMAIGEATRASVSYYSGTSIPTYTSVTGWPLRDSFTGDTGVVSYVYYYNIDDHFAYIEYLMDYYGWSYYDDSEAADGSYGIIYLVKGPEMIGIVANFKYNETIVMVTPSSAVATSISLNISNRTMIVGNQYTLEATVSPSNATDKSVTWSSSNSSVASVSSSGIVTAKSAGSATITAKTSNGKKATCTITVKNLVLDYYPNTQIPTFTCITGISLYESMEDDGTMMYFYDLDIESHTDYEAYLVNKDGWSILNEETASDYSYFSALYGKGNVTMLVMANFENDLTGIAFDVPPTTISVSGITLNKTSAKMTIGDTLALTATVSPSNATNKNVTWSSSNSNIASVSSTGVVTAKAVGTTTITAKTVDGNKTATCTVTVKTDEISVTNVTLNKTSAILSIGETETLIATITPADATNKAVTWSSSNTSVATVSSAGVVTAKAVGTATITAKTADGNKTATCTVTVKTATPLLEVEKVYGQKGKTVDVAINFKNNPGVALVGFNVNYNKDVMTLKSAELGDIFTGELDCNIESIPFVFNVYSGSGNKTNEGTLVTLQFEINEDCPVGEYNITLTNIECLNIDELVVNLTCTDGMITVRDSIPGDVIGDGSVTRSDLLRLAKHFSGFTVEIDEIAADVTGDGQVTRSDLLRLAKHFSGFDVELGN